MVIFLVEFFVELLTYGNLRDRNVRIKHARQDPSNLGARDPPGRPLVTEFVFVYNRLWFYSDTLESELDVG